MIAQEVFHSMRREKKELMTIKIDLAKTYDKLSWDFIKDILVDIGCPDNFVNLIWHCISYNENALEW